MKIKTETMKEMVAKAIQGAGNNQLIPITSLLGIKCNDGKLTLVTTDSTNYLYVTHAIEDKTDFQVVVDVAVFSKLIQRTSSEYIELDLQENFLEVKGNGTYSIELPLDEEGNPIVYPDPLKEKDLSSVDSRAVGITIVKDVLRALKPAVAVTSDLPQYQGYYVGDVITASDTNVIASLGEKITDNDILVSAEFMQMLDVITEEKFNMQVDGEEIVCTTPTVTVYGRLMDYHGGDGDNDYNIDAITSFLSTDFDAMCKVSKNDLVQVLERLELFVNPYDNNALRMEFGEKSVKISSKKSNGVEEIEYKDSKEPKQMSLWIDIEQLAQNVKSQAADSVEIQYGLDNAIKLVDGSITKILSLMDVENA